jgi:hypothetical protein
MALTEFQQQIADIAMSVAAPRGFAVGGGLALQLHGLGSRRTDDLDSYIDRFEAEPFVETTEALLEALSLAGYRTEVIVEQDVFRAIRVTRDGGSEQFVINLGYHGRRAAPIATSGLSPVEALQDVVEGKLDAVTRRAAARDLIDFDAIVQQGPWNVEELAAWRPGSTLTPVSKAWPMV